MNRRVAFIVLAGALVAGGLLRWRDQPRPERAVATPAEPSADSLAATRHRVATHPPATAASALNASASDPGAPRRPATAWQRPEHAPVPPAPPVDGAPQPRTPLLAPGDAPSPAGLPVPPAEALQVVPPQPLPPVSRVPLTPSAAGLPPRQD